MTTEVPKVSDTGRYPVAKAAIALGVCKNTVLKRIRSGEIRVIKTRDYSLKISGSEILRYWRTH